MARRGQPFLKWRFCVLHGALMLQRDVLLQLHLCGTEPLVPGARLDSLVKSGSAASVVTKARPVPAQVESTTFMAVTRLVAAVAWGEAARGPLAAVAVPLTPLTVRVELLLPASACGELLPRSPSKVSLLLEKRCDLGRGGGQQLQRDGGGVVVLDGLAKLIHNQHEADIQQGRCLEGKGNAVVDSRLQQFLGRASTFILNQSRELAAIPRA
eukprot:CAMPEP_0174751640 /NCGR_PEP_ID=MMETSP1094-20130205/100281_1 /TAXON_ID=156173 /ORGANISM="Chrysochromulina brevifilum, Strain UTEX LB 985" /LENGTH=211 /DNA_ID=CAMNT_0015957165 /DNA_START=365 /DNA_END=996 /DNA_ORIENTATION=-